MEKIARIRFDLHQTAHSGLNTFRGAAGWHSRHCKGSMPAQLVLQTHLLPHLRQHPRAPMTYPAHTDALTPVPPGHTSGWKSGIDNKRQS
jgi:hypothetical protein